MMLLFFRYGYLEWLSFDKQYCCYFIILFYPDDQQKNVFSLEVQDLNINEFGFLDTSFILIQYSW